MKKTLVFLAIALIGSTSLCAQTAPKHVTVNPGDTIIVDGAAAVIAPPPAKKYKPKKHKNYAGGIRTAPRGQVYETSPVYYPAPVASYQPDSNKYKVQYLEQKIADQSKQSDFLIGLLMAIALLGMLLGIIAFLRMNNRHTLYDRHEYAPYPPAPINQTFHNYGGEGGVGHGGESRNTINTGRKSGNVKDVDKVRTKTKTSTKEHLLLVGKEETDQPSPTPEAEPATTKP